MKLAPRNESEAFLCQDSDHIHLRMVRCTRRTFLGGLASLGAGAQFADQSASAEAAVDKPFRIDVHHHLSSPGFIAEITGRRTGQVPLMKWTVAQSSLPPMRRPNHASRFEGIAKTNLQASRASDTETLQSQVNKAATKRLSLSGLEILHGRPFPLGVQTTSARWPIANCGCVPMPITPGSYWRYELKCQPSGLRAWSMFARVAERTAALLRKLRIAAARHCSACIGCRRQCK